MGAKCGGIKAGGPVSQHLAVSVQRLRALPRAVALAWPHALGAPWLELLWEVDRTSVFHTKRSGCLQLSLGSRRHEPSYAVTLPRGQIVRGVVNTPGAILRTARGEAPAIASGKGRRRGRAGDGLGRKEHREREAATARPPWQLARGVEFRCSQVGEGPPLERSRAEPRASRREGLVLVARGSCGSCELTDSSWFLRSFVLAPCMRSCARIARRPFASDNCWDTRL